MRGKAMLLAHGVAALSDEYAPRVLRSRDVGGLLVTAAEARWQIATHRMPHSCRSSGGYAGCTQRTSIRLSDDAIRPTG